MSNRFDNKRLLYILGVLVLFLILTVLIKIPKERATLKDKIIEFDSTQVSTIILNSKATAGKTIEFKKSNGKWNVSQGTIESASRQAEVENIIIEIMSIKPQNLVSKNKAKWADFEVTDSTGTRIKFLNNKGKTLADLIVGKFSYKQINNQPGMYGRNSIEGTSYVRLAGENEVYGVDGFLSLSFNRGFNEWRDNTLVAFNRNDITSIKYLYPADSSYTLVNSNSKWMIGNMQADSAKVAGFISSLCNATGQDFDDNFKPDVNPDFQMVIEGNNLLSISVKCFKKPDGSYILNSSINPQIYFSSKPDGAYRRIFKSKKDLI